MVNPIKNKTNLFEIQLEIKEDESFSNLNLNDIRLILSIPTMQSIIEYGIKLNLMFEYVDGINWKL
jgi:hypothetical protein